MGLLKNLKLYLWHLIPHVVLVVDSSTTILHQTFKLVAISFLLLVNWRDRHVIDVTDFIQA